MLHRHGILRKEASRTSSTLSRSGAAARPGAFGQEARERVLERIRRALAEGDERGAITIARELERRFEAARPQAWLA